jgi:ribosomal protein L6P/L9E
LSDCWQDKEKRIPKIFNKVYLPEGVTIVFSYSQCIVTGPLGVLYINLKKLYKMPQQVAQAKKFLYSYQTSVRTAVQGVCYGHVEKVKLEGSGYKVMRCKPLKMKRTSLSLEKPSVNALPYRMVPVLTIRLGYSKLSQFRIPHGVKAAYNRFGQILFTSVSKSKLTAFTTKIKRAREPNPYRYRGVYEVGPVASRKMLKTPGKKN